MVNNILHTYKTRVKINIQLLQAKKLKVELFNLVKYFVIIPKNN